MAQSDNLADRPARTREEPRAPRTEAARAAARRPPHRPSGALRASASVAQALRHGATLLAAVSAEARLEAQLLLAHALDAPRSRLHSHPERPLGRAAAARYAQLLRRRANGEPVAYLLGEREFWSLPLRVDARALIPRPETELAVERCLALLGRCAEGAQPAVADLGTGSGAIALALARERPAWRITATDRSADALQLAAENARRLGIGNVEFVLGDWLAPLAGRRFALIVSNPPYVAAGDPALEQLRYEPTLALTPGASGLEALRRLAAEAPTALAPGGALVLEHGAQQGAAVRVALEAAGFVRVRCHRDLAGLERVSEGRRPAS